MRLSEGLGDVCYVRHGSHCMNPPAIQIHSQRPKICGCTVVSMACLQDVPMRSCKMLHSVVAHRNRAHSYQ